MMDAPGVNLILAAPGNVYACMSGTSFSAPVVTGGATLLRGQGATSVTQQLRTGGVNIDPNNPAYSGELGVRVDLLNAVHPN